MQQYLDIVRDVINTGAARPTRTGQQAIGKFGYNLTHDLENGAAYPLLTTKEMKFDIAVAETLGFVKGVTSAADFRALGTKIWDANANSPGRPDSPNQWLGSVFRRGEDDLGNIYGKQWNAWESIKIVHARRKGDEAIIEAFLSEQYEIVHSIGHDSGDGRTVILRSKINQLQQLVDGIKHNPFGRRHVVTAWNPGELSQMALPPCHDLFQVYVVADEQGEPEKLDLFCHMRSVDVFLGMPFNIAGYSLLLMMLAHVTNLKAGRVMFFFGDTHIYTDHVAQCLAQLRRTPKPLPKLRIVKRVPWEDDELRLSKTNDGFRTVDVAPMRPGETPEAFRARAESRDGGLSYWTQPSPYKTLWDFTTDAFQLENYDPYPPLYGKMAV